MYKTPDKQSIQSILIIKLLVDLFLFDYLIVIFDLVADF